MDEEQVKCEKTVDGAENGGSNNPKADDAQKESYMEERKAEKEQIESFRSICKTIVALLFVVSLIFSIYYLSFYTMIGVGMIIVSVLTVVLLEKLIDIICNLFVDVKAIRVLLWEINHK